MAIEATPGKSLRELMTQIVQEFAPDEQPVLDALEDLDDETAFQQLVARRQRDERLGFGLEEIGTLLSPVVWIAVEEAVRRIVDSGAERAGRSKRLRVLLPGQRRKAAVVTVPPLTRDQLGMVEREIIEATRNAGIDPGRGEAVAAGVVGRLVLAEPDDGSVSVATP